QPAALSLKCSLKRTPAGGAPPQTPSAQVSPVVHALPSSHPPPSFAKAAMQAPVEASQMPAWHWSVSIEQSTGWPTQLPERHASMLVHAFMSSHAPPSFAGATVHLPDEGSQSPTT